MRLGYLTLATALVAAPLAANAVTVSEGDSDGIVFLGPYTSTASFPIEIPFDVQEGFEAVLGLSIGAGETGPAGQPATALYALRFGLSGDPTAAPTLQFADSDLDPLNPENAGFEFDPYLIEAGETAYLSFAFDDGFEFGPGQQLKIQYEYTAELRPVGTGVIPLPATAWLLMGGIGGLAALGRRRRA